MKTTSIFVLFSLQISHLFSQNPPAPDPYWAFEPSQHFRPALDKGDFYRLRDFDFGWFVLEPITNFMQDPAHELERAKCLSYGQKALYFWWYVDAEVTNGGFVQFYYNGYAPYMPAIIQGLDYVGDTAMANLLRQADRIYQKNKTWIEQDRQTDVPGDDVYNRLGGFSALDDAYFRLNKKTMSLIANYIHQHPAEIAVDETGAEFDPTYSGVCTTYYPNQQIKDRFTLENGHVEGQFERNWEDGRTKEKIQYRQGKPTGEKETFYANGQLATQIQKDTLLKRFRRQWFYENGQPQKLEYARLDRNEKDGAYQEWYANGQLAKTGTLSSNTSRTGVWQEFYENGQMQLDAEFGPGTYLVRNAWNTAGEQTLKDGTGLYIRIAGEDRDEQSFKNYKRDGPQKNFQQGILRSYSEMENGLEHGLYRTYYENGALKQEVMYEQGKAISHQEFPKFKNPQVRATITATITTDWHTDPKKYVLPDNSPQLLNAEAIAQNFKVDPVIFKEYGDDFEMTYGYFVFVDPLGQVTSFEFAGSANNWLSPQVESNLKRLKFEPAIKNGRAIEALYIVQTRFKQIERTAGAGTSKN